MRPARPAFAAPARRRFPHEELYPPALRDLLSSLGPAKLNELSERALGYPALLVTCDYEAAAVLALAQKET